jgi:4-alpha-glucanotransferase
MEKLPALLNSTTMLICGEDLGLVPDSVPVVMDKLAITALKVQRMPSENIAWYDPKMQVILMLLQLLLTTVLH